MVALDERRKMAILATVSEDATKLSADERLLAAAMIDVLWGLPSYRRLINGWEAGATAGAAHCRAYRRWASRADDRSRRHR